ncbi:UNVERIFIED_CONTAM: hypothetical protein Slati_2403100 [Sesamum latifolium]|uniref:Retrotransposon gag domain-containing protein n=1 Tax=Sesamum latifolium TaxID=2727402 RepID=A0AAW2WEL0_9LAMI
MDTQEKTVKSVKSKLTISKSSIPSAKSIDVTTRSMSKKLKDSSQMTPLTEYVQKDFGSPNHASEGDGNKSPPSSPRSVFSHSFTTNVAPVMVTNATTIEEQLARTYGDHLVKQFVRSLKGNAFDWYTDLEASSIDRWKQLEQEFLNLFYNTQRTISMVELTNSRQWKKEPVIGYINRWKNLSLNCKDQLFEASAIEMCIQAMHWGLPYIVQGILPKSFEKLAIRAHDMELSMTASGVEGPPVQEFRRTREKQEIKKGGKPFLKTPSKESMVVNVAPFKLKGIAKDSVAPKNNISYEKPQRKLSLKKIQARQYPFLDTEYLMIYWRLILLIYHK